MRVRRSGHRNTILLILISDMHWKDHGLLYSIVGGLQEQTLSANQPKAIKHGSQPMLIRVVASPYLEAKPVSALICHKIQCNSFKYLQCCTNLQKEIIHLRTVT